MSKSLQREFVRNERYKLSLSSTNTKYLPIKESFDILY